MERTVRLFPALVAASILIAAAAHALPTNPDVCHTANCTPWSSVPINMLVAGTDAHQHRDAQNLLDVNGLYKTYAVWDDLNYRYNAMADRTLTKALDMQDFGHGFINRAPGYRFDNNMGTDVPLWARPILAQVIDQWAAEVNDLVNNSAGVAIETKIQFRQVVQGEQILIRFADKFPVANGAGGSNDMDFPGPSQIYPDGQAQIPPNPGGGAPKGGRNGVLAYWTPALRILTFNRKLLAANKWYQDTGNPAMDNNVAVQPNQFDLYTTALHEWGHVLGLDHPTNPMMNNIMSGAAQGERNMPNGLIRMIDPGSLQGAKNLYSVARCPAPVMAPPPPGGGGECEACQSCDSCCPTVEICPPCPVCETKP